MERTCHQRAFGKLNLTLDVLGRRPDGYHEMETVMQSVALSDDLTITARKGQGIRVRCPGVDLPRDLDNLAGKAARLFLERAGINGLTVDITIEKHIPSQAGMAGGSSDAAAVLRGLDGLLCTGLPESELLDLCARVGSDVAFCLRGGTALATGRGEVLRDLPPMPDCDAVLVRPDFAVSTPALFRALDGTAVTRRPDTAGFLAALERGDLPAIGAGLVNVFEEALPAGEREIVENVKAALLAAGAYGAALTGTGSVVFGLFPKNGAPKSGDLSRWGGVTVTSFLKKAP